MRAAAPVAVAFMTARRRRGIMETVAQPLVDRAEAATTKPIQLPPPHPVIVPATDLGGVAVLKHGNLYLLADAFGDIHADSRGLGLYDLDTRVLSCAILRINGVRPTLLRAQSATSHVATIQLTNPELRRDPAIKQAVEEGAARRAISIMRRRWIAGGLAERIEITNYSESHQELRLDLELDADAADMFEVRGRIRPERGTYLPTEATNDRVVFAYEGLDGLVRRTTVTFSPGVVVASERPDHDGPGGEGSVRVTWTVDVASGAKASVSWQVATSLVPGAGGAHPTEETPARLARSVTAGARDGIADPAAADKEYGDWQERCARIASDGELLDLAVGRSIADLRLLRNDGPERGEHYLAAGIPWFTTLFGRDSIITALQVLPFMPDVARETLKVLADWQATVVDPERDMEPGKILHELRIGEL